MFPKMYRRAASAGLLLASLIASAFITQAADAQTYPTTSPVYVPTAVLAPVTKAVTGAVTAQINGVATWCWNVTGTFTGVSITPQVAADRNAAPTWSSVSVFAVASPGSQLATVTTTGTYCLRTAGYAQARMNITAISTGSVVIGGTGNTADRFVDVIPLTRQTFSASASIGTGATTHFMSIAGSATKLVRITNVKCSGRATAAIAVTITAEKDSTADTGDAGTAVTATPRDTNDAVATATVLSHTTSPTPGTLVGAITNDVLSIANASTPVYQSQINWNFGTRPGEQEVTLRGVAESFSLNTSSAFGTAAAVACTITWTEV